MSDERKPVRATGQRVFVEVAPGEFREVGARRDVSAPLDAVTITINPLPANARELLLGTTALTQ